MFYLKRTVQFGSAFLNDCSVRGGDEGVEHAFGEVALERGGSSYSLEEGMKLAEPARHAEGEIRRGYFHLVGLRCCIHTANSLPASPFSACPNIPTV